MGRFLTQRGKENTKVLYIRVSPEIHHWIEDLAYLQDRSISSTVRQLLEEYYKEQMEKEENETGAFSSTKDQGVSETISSGAESS